MKSVFEKYLSNTPKYANQIQIQIFHLVFFQIQIQIQIFAYLNTNTYLTPALITSYVVSTLPADGLAPWEARVSEGRQTSKMSALLQLYLSD